MIRVRFGCYTDGDPLTVFGIFVRESDRRTRFALSDAMARTGQSLSNECGSRVGLTVSFEVAGPDWDAAEADAYRLAEALEIATGDGCDLAGWLMLTAAEAERLLLDVASRLGVTLDQPHREEWTWLKP